MSWFVLFLASKTVLCCLNNFAKRTFAVLTRLSSHPLILGLLTACSLFYRFLVIEFVWSNWFPFACVHVSKSSKRVIGKLEPWDILYRSTCKPKKKVRLGFLKRKFWQWNTRKSVLECSFSGNVSSGWETHHFEKPHFVFFNPIYKIKIRNPLQQESGGMNWTIFANLKTE